MTKTGGAAPAVYKINFDTSHGMIVVEVHRDWAPKGADHLYDLVKSGFYDGDRFFRVVTGFMAQFGINGDPKKNANWNNTPITDDPVVHSNSPGTLSFASRGANTRTTQLFFNFVNNGPSLDAQGFSPMGVVISGMDAMESIYAGYGEMAPRGTGPDPMMIEQQGNDYLIKQFPHLDYIKTATIQ